MTPKEENIVKHQVNCGTPKNRLAQFLLGMESIEKKVHPVIFQNIHMCIIFIRTYLCAYSFFLTCFLRSTPQFEKTLLLLRKLRSYVLSTYVYKMLLLFL